MRKDAKSVVNLGLYVFRVVVHITDHYGNRWIFRQCRQLVIWAETMWVIRYPFPEVGELNTPVLLLKAPFMEEVSKEIENSGGLI